MAFLLLLALSVYIPSADNIDNIKNGYENKNITLSEDNMINWLLADGVYISNADAAISINDINAHVNTVKIPTKILPDERFLIGGTMIVHYTEKNEVGEIIEGEMSVKPRVVGSNTYVDIDKDVLSLRMDVVKIAGYTLRANHVELNDRTPIIGLMAISLYAVVPSMVLALILIFVFYGKNVKPYLLKLKKYLPLLENLVSRDLKVKYRRSILGFLWSVLNPLLMALVINAVFSRLFRFDIQYFAVYYLSGTLIFNFIIECTTNSMTSIIGAAPLIRKVYLPKYIFPLEKCCFAFINMLFSLVAVVVVMIIQGTPFTPTLLLFPIPMIYSFMFAYGLSLALSALMVFFRDIQHLWSVLTTIWMYLTPIIYPENLLIDNKLGFVLKINPMYYYTSYFREIVMYGTVPSLGVNAICIAFAGIMLVIGTAVFMKSQDKFILYV